MVTETETTPRGPIAGDHQNPGPIYLLPPLVGSRRHDPRSNYYRDPAWHLGTTARAKYWDDSSPGPVYPNVPNTTRTGKCGGPHFSLYSRHKELKSVSHSFPGPGSYEPRKGFSFVSKSMPEVSMGIKPNPKDLQVKPAPNSYTLDSMLGKTARSDKIQASRYSLYPRIEKGNFAEDFHKTPGPAAYQTHDSDTTKKKGPLFTMRPKLEGHSFISNKENRLGPGSHHPEEVKIHMKANPSHSFGKKHSKHVLPAFMDVFE